MPRFAGALYPRVRGAGPLWAYSGLFVRVRLLLCHLSLCFAQTHTAGHKRRGEARERLRLRLRRDDLRRVQVRLEGEDGVVVAELAPRGLARGPVLLRRLVPLHVVHAQPRDQVGVRVAVGEDEEVDRVRLRLDEPLELVGEEVGGGDEGLDDSYLDIAGEFGSIRMGNTDDALDRMDGAVPSNWDENGNGGFAIGGKQGAGNETISFMAPAVSGISVYGFTSSEGTESGMGANYSNGPITVVYQSGEDGTNSETLIAANISMAGATVGFSSGDRDAAGTKSEHTSMGVKYTMGDLDVYYTSQKDGAGTKTKTALGGYYTIAPGLSAALETADNGSNQTTTYAHLQVSF